MKISVPVILFARLMTIATVAAGETSLAEKEAELARSADAEHGRMLYESRCVGCHSLDEDRVGPRHRGVYGRRAGGIEGYGYSAAVGASEIIWNVETLERWLTNPQALIPGQKMNFRVAKEADRLDIIAYLKRESGG